MLAIAAAKAFRQPVRGGRHRPRRGRHRARSTPVATASAPLSISSQARGLDHPALRGDYDLITANILAAPLRRLAPALAKALTPGGEIILSGLLGRDVPGIISAYRTQHLRLVARLDIDGWATLLMRR